MNTNLPEGAIEAVEELLAHVMLPLENWVEHTTDKSYDFKKTAVMCALINALVAATLIHKASAASVVGGLIIALKGQGLFDDDDETVH